MSTFLNPRSSEQEESHWLSVSDLMAGLMVVFLFIVIALMRDVLATAGKVKEIAVAYQQSQVEIYDSLMDEFSDDLKRWDADIDKETLTFIFQSPKVLFATGQIDLSEQYMRLLADFFPRYMTVLLPYRDNINEIRIEGHTSSFWEGADSADDAYFRNMFLSQGRTRSVLEYVYSLDAVVNYRGWVKHHVAAVGYSSSKAIQIDGVEDFEKSQRVSFRVITNADIRIKQILEVN